VKEQEPESKRRYRENEALYPLASEAAAARARWQRAGIAAQEAHRAQDPGWQKYAKAQDEQRARRDEAHQAEMREFVQRASKVMEDFKEAAIEEYRQSILYKFRINGSSIGELMAQEVDAWATSHGANVEFARRLIAGISLADNRAIKDIVRPAEADAIWSSVKGGADDTDRRRDGEAVGADR
jgi:hypothetical protein